MKYTLISGAAALAFTLCACDNIDEADRFIPMEFQQTDKVVLIEEFTGARCVNCPDGAATVAALHELHGNKVIPVSLYPSQLPQLTRPVSGSVDLRTDIATEIFGQYNKDNALPAAMFNRMTFDGKVLLKEYAKWSTPVTSILNDVANPYAPVNIDMNCTYTPEGRDLKVNYEVDFLTDVPEDVSFQVYVLENKIISKQYYSGGMLPDYENNHVLRAGLHDTWGKSYGASHKANDSFTGECSIKLAEDWKAENIQVVGFLCHTGGNREVLHATILESITE